MPMKYDNLPLLQEASQNKLRKLENSGDIIKKTYHRNATLHEKGTSCNTIEIICFGKIVAYVDNEQGNDRTLFAFQRGNVIGANLLFSTHNQYPMNIYCASEVSLICISRNGILELLHDYSFVMAFIRELSSNAQGLHQRVANFAQHTLRENILYYLQSLCEEEESKTIILPISKKQLADYLGVQRPSLFRELKKMKQEGILEIANRKITVLIDSNNSISP